jgi:two-component system sensor histidine kinase KdpD
LEDIGVLEEHEFDVVRWVHQNGKAAGAGTDTLAGAKGLYLPLIGSQSVVGVVGVVPDRGLPALDAAQHQLLDTACGQLAAALERALLAEQMRAKEIEIERERLRSSLLSSVSHDLRTPLASITGAASTLLDAPAALDAGARRELLQTISDESARLGRLVTNLLEMTRLEAGAVNLRREWSSVEELIGAALRRLDVQIKDRQVQTHVPADLPLVPVDAVLLEQVLINLIENAVKYSPADATIEISARRAGREIEVTVADRGTGIVAGEEDVIFEKFRRGSRTGTLRGVGLGLSVCKGIIEVHGGTISVTNRPGGGAEFRFRLPVPEQPAIEPEAVS